MSPERFSRWLQQDVPPSAVSEGSRGPESDALCHLLPSLCVLGLGACFKPIGKVYRKICSPEIGCCIWDQGVGTVTFLLWGHLLSCLLALMKPAALLWPSAWRGLGVNWGTQGFRWDVVGAGSPWSELGSRSILRWLQSKVTAALGETQSQETAWSTWVSDPDE